MADLNSLQKQGDLLNQGADSLAGAARFQAAQQSAKLFQQGDIKGAIGTLAAVDPAHAANLMSVLSRIDPNTAQQMSQAKTTGSLNAETSTGTNKQQLMQQQIDAGKFDKSQVGSKGAFQAKDPITGQVHIIDRASGQIINTLGTSSQNLGKPEEGKAPKQLQKNQEYDSQGNLIQLDPSQVKNLDKATTQFNKDTGDLTKKLQSIKETQNLVDKNVSGLGMIDKITFVKSLVQGAGRLAQQEIQGISGDQNSVEDRLAQIAERAKTGKLPPDMQSYMRTATQVVLNHSLDEYNQLAHQHAAQTGKNNGLDPSVVINRLVPSFPTVIQENLKKVDSLPKEDQQAIQWAHEKLLQGRKANPAEYDKGLQILQMHGL